MFMRDYFVDRRPRRHRCARASIPGDSGPTRRRAYATRTLRASVQPPLRRAPKARDADASRAWRFAPAPGLNWPEFGGAPRTPDTNIAAPGPHRSGLARPHHPPSMESPQLLAGRTGIVFGVANKRSLAWACTKSLS